MKKLHFYQMMCSKLCHDLAAPIGVVDNVIGMLNPHDEIKNQDKELFDLLKDSSLAAKILLIYYRTAFGSSNIKTLGSIEKLQNFMQDFCTIKNINYLLTHQHKENIDDNFINIAQILINLLGIIVSFAPNGGDLKIELQSLHDNLKIHIYLYGQLVPVKAATQKELMGDINEDNVDTHNVQIYLLNNFLTESNVKITDLSSSNDKLYIGIAKSQASKYQYNLDF